MKPSSASHRRVSIARVLVWIAMVAVSLAASRSGHLVMIGIVIPFCWYVLAYDLARTMWPDLFRSTSLRDVLLGDRPMARSIGLHGPPHAPFVPVAEDAAFPWLTIDEMGRWEQALVGSSFSLQSAQFVLSALLAAKAQTLASVEGTDRVERGPHHVSASQLCTSIQKRAHVMAGDRRQAAETLRSIGLRCREDVGRLVTVLVELGLVQKRESESLDEFHGLPWLEASLGPA